jgi:hypothetical protein
MTIEHNDCIKRGKIKPFSRGPALIAQRKPIITIDGHRPAAKS